MTIEQLEQKGIYKIIVTYADGKKKSFDIIKWSIFGDQIQKNLIVQVEYKTLLVRRLSNFFKKILK